MATLHTTRPTSQTVRVTLDPSEYFQMEIYGAEKRIITAVIFRGESIDVMAHKIRKSGQPYETGAEHYTSCKPLPAWINEIRDQHLANLAELEAAVAAVPELPAEIGRG
jgi:hypothetical protein